MHGSMNIKSILILSSHLRLGRPNIHIQQLGNTHNYMDQSPWRDCDSRLAVRVILPRFSDPKGTRYSVTGPYDEPL
jgi:hypothetical protein